MTKLDSQKDVVARRLALWTCGTIVTFIAFNGFVFFAIPTLVDYPKNLSTYSMYVRLWLLLFWLVPLVMMITKKIDWAGLVLILFTGGVIAAGHYFLLRGLEQGP